MRPVNERPARAAPRAGAPARRCRRTAARAASCRGHRQWVGRLLTAGVLVGAAVAAAVALAGARPARLRRAPSPSTPSPATARLVAPLAGAARAGLPRRAGARRPARERALRALAAVGARRARCWPPATTCSCWPSAYLLASVPLYALAGAARDRRGTEAALKTYLLGAFLGIVMLLGVTVLFGVSGRHRLRGCCATASPSTPQPVVAVGLVAAAGRAGRSRAASCPATSGCPTSRRALALGGRGAAHDRAEGRRSARGLPGAARRSRRRSSTGRCWSPSSSALTMTLGNLAAFGQDVGAPAARLVHGEPGGLPADGGRGGWPQRPGPARRWRSTSRRTPSPTPGAFAVTRGAAAGDPRSPTGAASPPADQDWLLPCWCCCSDWSAPRPPRSSSAS